MKSASEPSFGANASVLWEEIKGTYRLRPDELRLLEDACREVDLIELLEAELVGASLTVRGSQGQPVANPMVQELRQHRQVLKSLLGSLRLPDEDDARAGSPSAAGRALVANRWRRGA